MSKIPKIFKGKLLQIATGVELAICPALRGDVHSMLENLAEEAKNEICIANPLITIKAKDFVTRICKKAKSKGVNVRILTRIDPDKMNIIVPVLKAIAEIIGHENIRIRDSLHAKFAIFDKKTVFISSANLTGASTIDNDEIAVKIDLESVAKEAYKYFQDMWDSSKELKEVIR